MGIWYKEKRTFTDPNYQHNEEATEGMFEGTGLTTFDLDQNPKAESKKKMGNFDEADLQKAYTREQASLKSGDVYPHGDAFLRASTKTGHTSASKAKQDISLLTQ